MKQRGTSCFNSGRVLDCKPLAITFIGLLSVVKSLKLLYCFPQDLNNTKSLCEIGSVGVFRISVEVTGKELANQTGEVYYFRVSVHALDHECVFFMFDIPATCYSYIMASRALSII